MAPRGFPVYRPTLPTMQPSVGTVLQGKYEIVRRIGGGGMGEVYEARHARLAGRYAIKFLSQGGIENAEMLERFRREALVTSALAHPGIVQVFDFDQAPDGSPFLVMEFLNGQDLSYVLSQGARLPLADVASIVDQIASALTAAHRREIVHRDLKPQNVFVLYADADQASRIKIVDFGIAKIRSETGRLTHESSVMGTPQYMAPEQALGHVGEIDARTDQFALGAITYEMLAGQPAFTGDSLAAVVYQIVHATPPALKTLPKSVHREVSAVLGRALSKTREERFSTVTEFAHAFRRALGPALRSAPAVQAGTDLGLARTAAAVPSDSPQASSGLFGEIASSFKTKLSMLATQRGRYVTVGAGVGAAVVVAVVVMAGRKAPQPAKVSAPLAPIIEPSRLSHVYVKSDPPGAEVFLKGEGMPLGMTPVTLPLDLTGKTAVTIVLRKQGYEDYEQAVRNELPLSIALKAVPAVAHSEAPPPSSSEPVGKAVPAALQSARERSNSTGVRRAVQRTFRPDVAPATSSPATGAFAPPSNPSSALKVGSNPPGAEVVIDGESVGFAPLVDNNVDPRLPHSIALKKEGFESYEHMISSSDWSGPKDGFRLLKLNVKLRQKGPDPLPTVEPSSSRHRPNPFD